MFPQSNVCWLVGLRVCALDMWSNEVCKLSPMKHCYHQGGRGPAQPTNFRASEIPTVLGDQEALHPSEEAYGKPAAEVRHPSCCEAAHPGPSVSICFKNTQSLTWISLDLPQVDQILALIVTGPWPQILKGLGAGKPEAPCPGWHKGVQIPWGKAPLAIGLLY